MYEYHYSYYDLNGNGIEEMVVSTLNRFNVGHFSFVGLYTFDGDVAVTVENGLSARTYLTLYSDGLVCKEYSLGASLHLPEYYRLNGHWGRLDPVCSFNMDDNNPDASMVQEAHELSASKLIPAEGFDWKPLFTQP